MATREQRVDEALQQLLFRLIPTNADEDEAVEDQRFDEGLQLARNILGRHDLFPLNCAIQAGLWPVGSDP